jgi:hypothetical protein
MDGTSPVRLLAIAIGNPAFSLSVLVYGLRHMDRFSSRPGLGTLVREEKRGPGRKAESIGMVMIWLLVAGNCVEVPQCVSCLGRSDLLFPGLWYGVIGHLLKTNDMCSVLQK